MTVWAAIEEALTQRFTTAWANTSPVQLGNELFDPPDGLWAHFITQRRGGGPGTIGKPGNRKMDRVGAVFILLRVPPGRGTRQLSEAAERACKIFENCRIAPHDIRFAQVEPGPASHVEEGRWWGVTIEGRFDYEDLV